MILSGTETASARGARMSQLQSLLPEVDLSGKETVQQVEQLIGLDTVRIWHMNDAKAPRGSKLDRHEHIGEGTMGLEPFRRLLNDLRFDHCAFIAETPVDEEGDEERNVQALKRLVKPAE